MVFPAVIHGFESWTIKKAEHQRTDAFKLWHWGRFLRVPWTARKLDQSILKESKLNIHWKDWCWRECPNSGYFGYLIGRANSLEKPWCWERVRAAGQRNDRGKDGCMGSPTQRTSLSKPREMIKDREAWHAVVHGVAKSRTWLSDWTSAHSRHAKISLNYDWAKYWQCY